MNYDLYIGGNDFNYTFNVSKLFYDHMPPDGTSERGGLHTLDGCTGRVAGDKIARALDRIEGTRRRFYIEGAKGEPEFCHLYDAPNGWGSALGALLFLSLVMAACYQNPRKRLRMSS